MFLYDDFFLLGSKYTRHQSNGHKVKNGKNRMKYITDFLKKEQIDRITMRLFLPNVEAISSITGAELG